MSDFCGDSPAHKLLLSKYMRPHTIDDYSTSGSWREVLGELPTQAIDNFVRNGLLRAGNLRDHIYYKYKVPELKIFLRQLPLPVSGRKDELISRLIQADSMGMEIKVQDIEVLICTERGLEMGEQYIMEQEQIRDETEWQVFKFLQDGRFGQACSTVSEYEANQVFQRGFNVDWNNFDYQPWIKILNNIFSSTPKVLVDNPPNIIEPHRILAGMKHVWGKFKIQKWAEKILVDEIDFQLNIITSLISYAQYSSSLEIMKEDGFEHVKIVSYVNDQLVCDECKILNKQIFEIENVPEFRVPIVRPALGVVA